jgi:hypothetical protein
VCSPCNPASSSSSSSLRAPLNGFLCYTFIFLPQYIDYPFPFSVSYLFPDFLLLGSHPQVFIRYHIWPPYSQNESYAPIYIQSILKMSALLSTLVHVVHKIAKFSHLNNCGNYMYHLL